MPTRDRASQVVEQNPNTSQTPEEVVKQVGEGLTSGQQEALKEDIEIIQQMSRNIGRFSDQEQPIRELIIKSTQQYSNNPRDVKRFVNLFRFYYFLRAAREARNESVPSLDQMCRWIILSLRWPEVVRWFRRPLSGSNHADSSPLTVLEGMGASCQDLKGWQRIAQEKLALKGYRCFLAIR